MHTQFTTAYGIHRAVGGGVWAHQVTDFAISVAESADQAYSPQAPIYQTPSARFLFLINAAGFKVPLPYCGN